MMIAMEAIYSQFSTCVMDAESIDCDVVSRSRAMEDVVVVAYYGSEQALR